MSGGNAPWLSYSERSQVRSYASRLDEPNADQWRGILRGRSELRRVRAHPAAVARLGQFDHVLLAGPAEAVRRGFDLVAMGEPKPEVYMPSNEWDHIARSLALKRSHDSNLIIRHPLMIWPFADREAVPDAAISADLLDSAEPRAVRAGELRLNELLKDLVR